MKRAIIDSVERDNILKKRQGPEFEGDPGAWLNIGGFLDGELQVVVIDTVEGTLIVFKGCLPSSQGRRWCS